MKVFLSGTLGWRGVETIYLKHPGPSGKEGTKDPAPSFHDVNLKKLVMDDRVGLVQSLLWRTDTVDPRMELRGRYLGVWAKSIKGFGGGWFWWSTWMKLKVRLSSVILSSQLSFGEQWRIKRVIILKLSKAVVPGLVGASPTNGQASTRFCTIRVWQFGGS